MLMVSCMTFSESNKWNKIKYIVMKLRFFLTAIVAFLAFEAHAQQGLNVNALFQGKVVPHEEMVDVRVKGRAISKYKLDFYRSIRFNATEQQR